MNAVQTTSATLRVLMLGLGGETFAIEAGMVREIIDPIPATRVPGARPHLPGVVNVRGSVIPLCDIRVRLGMDQPPDTIDTRMVVVELLIDGEPMVLAIVADKVLDVTDIVPAEAQQMPRIGLSWDPQYIRFIIRWNGDFIIVPDLERILN